MNDGERAWHHRRSAARLVLPARGEARLPAFRRRLCRDRRGCRGRAGAHRPRAASRWRSSSSTPAPGRDTARPEYVASGCGMGREATMYLLERGVRVTGTDAWSWDAPFVHTAKHTPQTHDAALIWEGHKAGRHIGYCHIEKLHNLEALAGGRLHRLVLSRQDRAAPRRAGPARWRSSRSEGTTQLTPSAQRSPNSPKIAPRSDHGHCARAAAGTYWSMQDGAGFDVSAPSQQLVGLF